MIMAVHSETEINLKTLQRVDSSIVEILDYASQVAIYKYEKKLNKWEGTDIEGTLFLYKRTLFPFHGFIIVNRMSTTNFVEPITSDLEIVLQEPYFLYKKSCGEIVGSWFYEYNDFKRITNKIQSIVLKQTGTPRRQRRSSEGDSRSRKDEAVHDIMSLLSEAHKEYVKTDASNLNHRSNAKDCNFNGANSNKILCSALSGANAENRLPPAFAKQQPSSTCRRLLSSKSYDPSFPQPAVDGIFDMLVANSSSVCALGDFKDSPPTKREFQGKPCAFAPESMEKPVPSRRLFSSGKNENAYALSSLAILEKVEESPVPLEVNDNQNFSCSLKPAGEDVAHFQNNFESKEFQSEVLKDSLLSNMEKGPDILFKIHEAYISSLKSIFAPTKSF